MQLKFDSVKPIYIQIAEAIEDDIMGGLLKEGDPCYSQLTISKELNVNPATAAKGINLLVSEEVLHKQRGLAMVVAPGAKSKIVKKRRTEGFQTIVEELVLESIKLGLSREYVLEIINKCYLRQEGNRENE